MPEAAKRSRETVMITGASADNLWDPLPGDRGAHGRFDLRARESSGELWAATHESWLATGAALIVAGAAAVSAARR